MGQIVAGIVLAALGGGWLSFVVGSRAIGGLGTWLFVTPMLIAGVVVFLLGIVIIFGRERWIVDRNLLVFRSRLFGWKSEHQYVDGILNVRVRLHADPQQRSEAVDLGTSSSETRPAECSRSYTSDRDDDVPRQLGAVLSRRTGWPLHDPDS